MQDTHTPRTKPHSAWPNRCATACWRATAPRKAWACAITGIAPGAARMEMAVRDDMLNGFDICHGGFITALADTAFAYACNARNEMTVASGLSVDFVAPGRPGDVLTAQAREVSRAGRTGVYDVQVTNQRQEVIALFRGRSHSFKGRPTVPGLTEPA